MCSVCFSDSIIVVLSLFECLVKSGEIPLGFGVQLLD